MHSRNPQSNARVTVQKEHHCKSWHATEKPWLRACVRACVRSGMRACVRACVRAFIMFHITMLNACDSWMALTSVEHNAKGSYPITIKQQMWRVRMAEADRGVLRFTLICR